MFRFVTKYKREFVYSSFIFLVYELLVTPGFTVNWQMYLLTSVIGMMLLTSWILMVHTMHGGKKVSRWSQVLLKISLGERLFANVLVPIIFYSTVCLFLFVDVSRYLNQLVIVISVFLLFVTMLHIRTSYEKVFSIEKMTRSINDFINIIVYFLLVTGTLRLGLPPLYLFIISSVYAAYTFIYMLVVRRRYDEAALIISIACSFAISAIFILSANHYLFISPIFSTILVYLVVSIMHIRFNGATRLEDYIPPLMYSLMALILVLSL